MNNVSPLIASNLILGIKSYLKGGTQVHERNLKPKNLNSKPTTKQLGKLQKNANSLNCNLSNLKFWGISKKSKFIYEVAQSLAKKNGERTKDDWWNIAIFWAEFASLTNYENKMKTGNEYDAKSFLHLDRQLSLYLMLKHDLVNNENRAMLTNYLREFTSFIGIDLPLGNELEEFQNRYKNKYFFPPNDYKAFTVSKSRIEEDSARQSNIFSKLFGVKKETRMNAFLPQLLSRYIKKENLILDIGCGDGGICYDLLEMGFNVIGIDPSSQIETSGFNSKYPKNFVRGSYESPEIREQILAGAKKASVILYLSSLITYANDESDFNSVLDNSKPYLNERGYIIVDGLGTFLPMQYWVKGEPIIFPSLTLRQMQGFLEKRKNRDFQILDSDPQGAVLQMIN
ncbi:MAG: hypothetical protein QNJ31_01455 [Candidatus Caenarcaniphilales bacterium]|nr:hypothetical protein [Candidatus Caenarcaniphilales bacterium]